MLGYIKRIGKEFTDPYILRTLYNTFVRSNLDYASVIWSPYYGVHIDRIDRKFVRFALRFLGWQTGVALPPYWQRCKLIDLELLYARRDFCCATFIRDILCSRFDCSVVLSLLNFSVPRFYIHALIICFGKIHTARTTGRMDRATVH
jgi:hypothetical protein